MTDAGISPPASPHYSSVPDTDDAIPPTRLDDPLPEPGSPTTSHPASSAHTRNPSDDYRTTSPFDMPPPSSYPGDGDSHCYDSDSKPGPKPYPRAAANLHLPPHARNFYDSRASSASYGPGKKAPLVLLHLTLLLLPGAEEPILRKITPTMLERGLLIEHPRSDYQLLEELIFDALGLDDDTADTADDEWEQSLGVRRIRGKEKWEVRVYAANGLMTAGAWRRVWSEMERIDVEVGPRNWRGTGRDEMIRNFERLPVPAGRRRAGPAARSLAVIKNSVCGVLGGAKRMVTPRTLGVALLPVLLAVAAAAVYSHGAPGWWQGAPPRREGARVVDDVPTLGAGENLPAVLGSDVDAAAVLSMAEVAAEMERPVYCDELPVEGPGEVVPDESAEGGVEQSPVTEGEPVEGEGTRMEAPLRSCVPRPEQEGEKEAAADAAAEPEAEEHLEGLEQSVFEEEKRSWWNKLTG